MMTQFSTVPIRIVRFTKLQRVLLYCTMFHNFAIRLYLRSDAVFDSTIQYGIIELSPVTWLMQKGAKSGTPSTILLESLVCSLTAES